MLLWIWITIVLTCIFSFWWSWTEVKLVFQMCFVFPVCLQPSSPVELFCFLAAVDRIVSAKQSRRSGSSGTTTSCFPLRESGRTTLLRPRRPSDHRDTRGGQKNRNTNKTQQTVSSLFTSRRWSCDLLLCLMSHQPVGLKITSTHQQQNKDQFHQQEVTSWTEWTFMNQLWKSGFSSSWTTNFSLIQLLF